MEIFVTVESPKRTTVFLDSCYKKNERTVIGAARLGYEFANNACLLLEVSFICRRFAVTINGFKLGTFCFFSENVISDEWLPRI